MSRIFGNKDNFAIEYEFIDNPEKVYINSTYGYIKLWVKGTDICTYNKNYQHEGDIYYLVEWFCDKIEYILGYDIFPLSVKGNTAVELIENADQYESDDMLEFVLWYAAKSRWILNHCWFNARNGAVLPCVYFRRFEKCIEISWDNTFWRKEGIIFSSEKDIHIVQFEVFSKILADFLISSVNDLEQRIGNGEKLKVMKRQINILKGD